MRQWRSAHHLIGASIIAVTSACDQVADPAAQEPVSPVTIELASKQVEVVAGLTGPGPTYQQGVNVPLTIHRNGYAGELTLTAELIGATGTAPSVGITGPWLIGLPGDAGSVVVTVPSGVPSGTYHANIRAQTTLGSRYDTLTIVVVPFAARIGRVSLNVAAGATNTVSVRYKPASAQVTVAASPIAGLGVNVTSSAGVAYVDVSAAAGATAGAHELTITVTSGSFEKSWVVPVTVQAAPSKRAVTFRLCRHQSGPGLQFLTTRAVAYANDGEAWISVTADANGMYTISAADRVSIAEQFDYPGTYAPGSAVRVLHLTADELEAMNCGLSRGSNFFNVRVANATQYFLSLGAFRASSPSVRFGSAGAGPSVLIATGTVATQAGSDFRAVVTRDVTYANGDSIIADLAAAESFPLDSASLSMSGLTTPPTVHVHAGKTIGRVGGLATTSVTRYWALPESKLAAAELQSLLAGTTTRGVLRYFRAATPLTLSLGPELLVPTVDLPSLTISLPRQAEYPDIAGVGQLTVLDFRGVYAYAEIWQSKGYAGSSATPWVFTWPDLGRFWEVKEFLGDATLLGGIAGKGPTHLFFGGAAAAGDEITWARLQPTRFGIFLPFPTGH